MTLHFISLAMAALCASSLSARDLSGEAAEPVAGVNRLAGSNILLDDPANRSYVGLRAGLDVSAPTSDLFCNGAGFHVGAVYNAALWKNFYIEPGAMLYYDTWGLKDKSFQGQIGQEVREVDLKSSFRTFGVRIPLMFGYHFDFTPDLNVAVFTGPELSIGLQGRYHYKATVAGMPDKNVSGQVSCYSPGQPSQTGNEAIDKLLDQVQDIFHRVDCAWKIGVGVNYSNFHVSVGGAIGMNNVYKHSNVSAFSNDSFRMNQLTVTLGYNF